MAALSKRRANIFLERFYPDVLLFYQEKPSSLLVTIDRLLAQEKVQQRVI